MRCQRCADLDEEVQQRITRRRMLEDLERAFVVIGLLTMLDGLDYSHQEIFWVLHFLGLYSSASTGRRDVLDGMPPNRDTLNNLRTERDGLYETLVASRDRADRAETLIAKHAPLILGRPAYDRGPGCTDYLCHECGAYPCLPSCAAAEIVHHVRTGWARPWERRARG